MLDAVELVKLMKKASLEATESAKPVQICFGQVLSISPLKINVEQKMSLTDSQFILCRNVTDFFTTMEIEGIAGEKKVTVKNALKVGEQVILLRQQGGQKYLVIDRMGVM